MLDLSNWRAGLLCLTLVATPALAQDDPLKVGYVYVGPTGDFGWTYQHDQGRLALEAALGEQVETTYVENVAEGADAERVIRQLASTGHDLVFTTSFGFMNPTIKVAQSFPEVKFEHATGYKRADNVATYMGRFYEGRWVAGIIAGHMTESDTLGYIASFPIPEVIRGINAFTLGAQSVNPDVQVRVVFVNSWFDPGKEAEAAGALIDQGADVLSQITDSPAAVQAAEGRGVYAIGQASDMSEFGPNAHLTAIIDDWSGYYIERVQAVLDGNWESTDTWGGFDTGMVKMGPYHEDIPTEVVALAEEAEAAISAGTLHPFTGPIRNQSGEVVVPAGETLDDAALLSMDWFVEGVQGRIPD